MNRPWLQTIWVCVFLATCPAWLAAQPNAKPGSPSPGVPQAARLPLVVKGLDPVLLSEGHSTPGQPQLEVQRGRFRYRFAGMESRRRFLAAPERFEVQRNGQCAMMPAAPGNPELYTVHDGRIYLFGSPECRAAFVADPTRYLKSRRNVAILLFDGVELLDFAGPGEVLSTADEGRAFNVYTVAARPGPITSQGFVQVQPQFTFADCPSPDILVVPGGGMAGPLKDTATQSWIRETSKKTEVTFSVCTGALLLGKAGLLDGREATTHSRSLEELRKLAPAAQVRSGRRYVDSGQIVTSAGVSAGTDAALHLVARFLGEPTAQAVAQRMEYRWEQDGTARVETRR